MINSTVNVLKFQPLFSFCFQMLVFRFGIQKLLVRTGIRRFFVYFGCFRLFLEWSVRGKSNE